jgi:putative restriction endonuclease
MAKLLKTKLIEIFIDAIQIEGGIVESRTPRGTHPAVIHVRAHQLTSTFRLYIWNLSRGGSSRPVDEYRIQVSGLSKFEQQPRERTLILGYWSELQLFVAFDYVKHTSQLGSSVSLQVRKKALDDALTGAIALYSKNNENVVVFGQGGVLTYLRNHEAIHAGRYEPLISLKRGMQLRIGIEYDEPAKPHD